MTAGKHIYFDLTCEFCGDTYTQRSTIYRKAVWKNRCPLHRAAGRKPYEKEKKTLRCVDCNDFICRGSTRCKICSNKLRATPRKNCVDCGKKISILAEKRCLKCHNKNQDKGLSIERTKFNTSPAWSKIRTAAFERDNYTCILCGDHNYKGRGNGTVRLEGHHLLGFKDFHSHRLILENIKTLCRSCHLKWHHNKEFKISKICQLI